MDMIRLIDLIDACPLDTDLITKTFPDGMPVTAQSMAIAMAAGLNIQWLENLLPPASRADLFKKAMEEFDERMHAARERFHGTIAGAHSKFDGMLEACEESEDEENEIVAAQNDFVRDTARAWSKFIRARTNARNRLHRAVSNSLLAALQSL